MSSEAPKPLARTQPDGTRSVSDEVLAQHNEVLALRHALDVILSVDKGGPESTEQDERSLLGTSDAIVTTVALVVRRAHQALHEHADPSEALQRRCAEVLFTALPESVSRRLILADSIAQVRFLAREHNAERAVPLATATLLGWTDIAARALARAVDLVVTRSGH